MSTPGGWTAPQYALPLGGGGDGGPAGIGQFASWTQTEWNQWLNARFAEWLEQYGIPFEYLDDVASSLILAFQGETGPLEDLIEDAVREIPVVGDMIGDLWDAIRGEYEGDNETLLGVQAFFALVRRVLQLAGGLGGGGGLPTLGEIEDGWDAGVKTLRDRLTGIVEATDTDVDDWVLGLLTGDSDLDAANLVGTIAATLIPGLDASKITAGVLNVLRVPDLDAGKIISGALDILRIPSLDASKIGSGTLGTGRIPDLDAGKIITGVLNVLRVPDLDAGKVTSGTLGTGRIPDLDATKIVSGLIAAGRIPDLDATKIVSGTFPQSRIASLVSDLAAKAGASDLTNLAANINALGTGSAAGSGPIATAWDTISNLFGTAAAAQAAAMAAQQQLQDIQNETSDPTFSGFAWSTIFSGGDGNPLPSGDWTASGLTIRGDNGYVGVQAGSSDGTYRALTTAQFLSDTQSASIVLGSRASLGDSYQTGVYVRCDASMTTGAYCHVNRSTITIGKFTRSGTTWTFTGWTSVSRTQNQGDIVRLKTTGDNYYVLVNGVTVISYTDTGATVPKGASYRRAGITCRRDTSGFFTDDSFRIASFAMADWQPAGATVTTPAWRLRRGSASFASLSISAGGSAAVPASFFTVNDLTVSVTVSNLGVGTVTISEDGWYELSFTAAALAAASNGDPYVPCLWGVYVDSTLIQGPIHSGGVATVYLTAGQVVSPRAIAAWPAVKAATSTGSSAITRQQANSDLQQTSAVSSIGGPAAAWTGRKVA